MCKQLTFLGILGFPTLLIGASQTNGLPPALESLKLSPHYQAGETSIKLYGTANSVNLHETPRLGVGLGVDHFFTKGFGVGGTVQFNDLDDVLIDSARGRVIVRAPLWDKVAPYGYAEGGWSFKNDVALFGMGGGIDWRLKKSWSVFVEAGPVIEVVGGKQVFGETGLEVRAGVGFTF